MTSIEHCAPCTTLEQRLEFDYERGAVRLATLDALTPLAQQVTTSDSPGDESSSSSTALRCPGCGTIYSAQRSTDPGHSFMDPTHDTESVTRLTLHGARAFLSRFTEPAAAVASDELESREGVVLDELSTMLGTPGRAPTWHVQRFALECLTDAFLTRRDHERLERLLLRHEDPVVRVEVASDLVDAAFSPWEGWKKRAAAELLEGGRVLPVLASVLREPIRDTWRFSSDFHGYRQETTHCTAARSVGRAAYHGATLDDALADRLVLLLTEGEAEHFHALGALSSALGRSPTLARRLLPVLHALPAATLARERTSDLLSLAAREAAKVMG